MSLQYVINNKSILQNKNIMRFYIKNTTINTTINKNTNNILNVDINEEFFTNKLVEKLNYTGICHEDEDEYEIINSNLYSCIDEYKIKNIFTRYFRY
jgi:hypothetical protein